MTLKDVWDKTGNWLRAHKPSRPTDYQPQIDDDGLISQDAEFAEGDENDQNSHIVVKAVPPKGKAESLEKLQAGFDKLVGQLQGINEHLNRHVTQNEDLMSAAKDQQFVETIEKIPTETAKQTDALVDIDHQLAAVADTDVQMTESFNKFNETLDKLNESTIGQTDGIMQMSKTFATSDRYLKYIMSRQRKSFIWVFMIAMGVCVVAILILAGIIIYLRQ
jgi:hypothetical protein